MFDEASPEELVGEVDGISPNGKLERRGEPIERLVAIKGMFVGSEVLLPFRNDLAAAKERGDCHE